MKQVKLKPIQSITFTQEVYENIAFAILSGKIPPGEKLTLEGLAAQLGVSIQPVREAVKRLEAADIVVVKSRRIAVNELSVDTADQIGEIRVLVECYAAKKACKKRSDESLHRLKELNDLCLQHHGNPEELYKANNEFHHTIYRESGIPILIKLIDWLGVRLSPYFHFWLREAKEIDHAFYLKCHEGMIRGMIKQNSKELCKWLKADLIYGHKALSKSIRDEQKRLEK